jgi:uncharacterized protein YbaP (TraB family)
MEIQRKSEEEKQISDRLSFLHDVQREVMNCAPMRLWTPAKYESKSHSINIRYMKHFLFIILLAASCSLSATAQPAMQKAGAGVLWHISGNGLKSDSYILGTGHSSPISFVDSIKGFSEVWNQVTQVATETALADLVDSLQNSNVDIFLKYFSAKEQTPVVHPFPNVKYKDLYTDTQLNFMDSILNPFVISKMTVAEISPLRLWYQYLNVVDFVKLQPSAVKDPLNSCKNIMDVILEKRCKSAGKRHIKLEECSVANNAIYKSIMLVDSCFNLNEQADILYQCAVYEAKSKKRLHADCLQKVYQENDFEKYKNYLVQRTDYINSLALPTAIKIRLFQYEKKKWQIQADERTLNWMDKILTEIKSAPTLVAVGINHLIGENGLIHLLRQYGYTVEPVK